MFNDIMTPLCDYVYYPEMEQTEIKKGEFLDIEQTIKFKSLQLSLVAQAFIDNKVKDGDKFFVADIFFPGIESIKYMAELQNIKVEVIGYNHAGRADKHDFIQKLNKWSDYSEKGYMEMCDRICVGSEFHKKLVCDYFNIPTDKVYVTGCVWDNDYAFDIYPHYKVKKRQVIFPHRLSDEKGLDVLLDIVKQYPEMKFIITSPRKVTKNLELPKNVIIESGITKSRYYELLSESMFYLSCARQETFGYTLREALLYKCIPVVPDKLSYVENLPEDFRYRTADEAVELLKTLDHTPDIEWVEKHNKNINKIMDVIYDR